MKRTHHLSAVALVCGASFGFGPSARADEVATCVEASEQAQQLRDEGKYLQAKQKLLVCVRDTCPGIVRKDCAQWLADIDARMPFLVVQVHDDDGNDLADVTVTVDGAPFTTRLDGKPLPIDPGEHLVRVETPGLPAVEQKIVMHAGERSRPLTLTLADPKKARKPERAQAIPSPPSPAPSLVPVYALAGVGAVGLGGFAYFWFTGKSDIDDLRSTCAGSCDSSKVDAAQRKLVIADVSLAVGAAALGVAGILLLTQTPRASRTTTASLVLAAHPLPGGGVTTLGGRF